MEINPISNNAVNKLQIDLRKDGSDFERIIQQAIKDKDKQKLKEVCQQLEATFIGLMLNEMRKTIPEDSLTGNSLAKDVFTSMLYDKYAEMLAQNGSFGLADQIYNQLSKKV
ncbi:MAG: rod-binding protein [Thermoanaerobacter sp.]|jgi:flagellar protein FlgJ|uniref:rod-binding protein n=1 Tax=unclassified Thermoanaerobacter TaxID=2636821 RepID=UPI0001B28133|nr:rod-binding protein [Thermoanaerobacter sp. A7A]KUJ91402.1 MAG: Flagellar protein FlgJ-like protein [Thermoanaerobacter thermocopriae]MDI3501214.1 peptidoglycan hydrolase FlgJ [Thermoanaerobacter sp.]MDI3528641.1 peptidoglycan hydrolase FlgJ [Thermoanaerobacter sp.]MDK2814839.1 peptidoglycan hydrolase FlgJ [Thermoanaerobacter sp.]HCD08885.1 muramidase [Thermoanaerobacter sp.]